MLTFTPVYSNNKYKFHSSPTGARVVPTDKTGKQCVNSWEFHYQNWKAEKFNEETYVRTGVSLGNLKPGSRKGCLDVEVLRQLGLTPDQVRNNLMFLYQMLFPICNPCRTFPICLISQTCTRCGRVLGADTVTTLHLF